MMQESYMYISPGAEYRAVDHANWQDIFSLFSLYKAVLELRKNRSLEIECCFIAVSYIWYVVKCR